MAYHYNLPQAIPNSGNKLIIVVGGTGAQGLATIRYLLKPGPDGESSPYRVRVLTRDANHARAKHLASLPGVEVYQGNYKDNKTLPKLFEGAYGAFVNTDGFSVGAALEGLAAHHLYEAARATPGFEHFVWSGLDYSLRKGNWNPEYQSDFFNGKGRFSDFLTSQGSAKPGQGFFWTSLTVSIYMDLLAVTFSPMYIREDGTRVFISPIGDTGRVALLALDDLGWWVRYTFDNADETSGKTLDLASETVGMQQVVDTFTKVTGLPAEFKKCTMDEYFALYNKPEAPLATDLEWGTPSWGSSFAAWLAQCRDNIIQRPIEWIKSVHPESYTVERWMTEKGYRGEIDIHVLKSVIDGRTQVGRNPDKIRAFVEHS